jgi:hypothetical protein
MKAKYAGVAWLNSAIQNGKERLIESVCFVAEWSKMIPSHFGPIDFHEQSVQ